MRDKIIDALARLPGVTVEIAEKLKAAGLDSPRAVKAATEKELKAAGMKTADINKLKAHKAKLKLP
jgi:hypothetical protein